MPKIVKDICDISPNIVVAGGSIYQLLIAKNIRYDNYRHDTETYYDFDRQTHTHSDVDIFMYDMTDQEMLDTTLKIIQLLETNTTLTELNIQFNHLGNECITHLNKCLKYNKTITKLCINPIDCGIIPDIFFLFKSIRITSLFRSHVIPSHVQ